MKNFKIFVDAIDLEIAEFNKFRIAHKRKAKRFDKFGFESKDLPIGRKPPKAFPCVCKIDGSFFKSSTPTQFETYFIAD